uniref:Uncharacterized protein n=1 Tax=Ditylenchus dipsaci TaxID=166011 RepID=A0A915EDS0_9BILA
MSRLGSPTSGLDDYICGVSASFNSSVLTEDELTTVYNSGNNNNSNTKPAHSNNQALRQSVMSYPIEELKGQRLRPPFCSTTKAFCPSPNNTTSTARHEYFSSSPIPINHSLLRRNGLISGLASQYTS